MDLLRDVAEILAKKPGILGNIAVKIIGESDWLVTKWVITQLDIQPGDVILDLGCGFGSAIRAITKRYRNIFIVGIDGSQSAINQAWERNKKAAKEKRLMLLNADLENHIPTFSALFTKVYAINAIHNLENPVKTLAMVKTIMAPGSKIVLAVQPQEKGATDAEAIRLGKAMRNFLIEAGFKSVKLQEKPLAPVAAVSVTGIN